MINNNIYPCFCLEGTAEKAARLYARAFPSTRIISSSSMVTLLDVNGQKLMLLNGGPAGQVNSLLSMMVLCDREQDVVEIYNQLLPEGKILMALGSYPWSTKYAWVQDRFGISWQVYKGERQGYEQKLVPTLMFTGQNNGRADEAIHFYTSVFPDSEIEGVLQYEDEKEDIPGNIKHAQFNLSDYVLAAMDSSRFTDINFSEGTSMVVETADQKETDRLWELLTADGGADNRCGWLKDKFGFSWQIVPQRFIELMADTDTARVQRVTDAMLTMRKPDIAALEKAAAG